MRWAEATTTSLPTSSVSSTLTASSITSRSESRPSTMPTRTAELRCGDRAVANVPPVVQAVERDSGGGRVGTSHRIANVAAVGRDAEHAATGRDETAVALGGSRVKDLNAVERHTLHTGDRSEEHTSELQSPCNLVCRLLLEKK